MDVSMTTRGRIVIPAQVRRALGIKKGTSVQLDVDEQAHKIILTPMTREYIQGLHGRYKGEGLLKAFVAGKNKD